MSHAQDFGVFWEHYPRKIGKLAAEKAYARARKSGVTQAQLLEGITRYIAGKPAYADYCHPATWLNQGRWMDEPDTPILKRAGFRWENNIVQVDWFEECKQMHGGACGLSQHRHHMRKLIDEHKGREAS